MQHAPEALGVVVAERSFVLFELSGKPVQITARIGMPVGLPGEYRCPVQVVGVGDERIRAPYGEDAFVALQFGIDLLGELL